MRIFGWAADRAAPGYYRLRLPLGQLRAAGHEVTVAEQAGRDEEVVGLPGIAARLGLTLVQAGQVIAQPGFPRKHPTLSVVGPAWRRADVETWIAQYLPQLATRALSWNLREHRRATGVSAQGPTTEELIDSVDVWIAQRTSTPGASQLWQRIARRPNRPLMVYETDDDLLSVEGDNAGHHYYNLKPETRRWIVANIRVADLVTVSTEPLADAIRSINPNVVVLPNYVDARLLNVTVEPGHRFDGQFYIGWQGSATHEQDFAEASPHLRRILRDHPHTVARFLGTWYAKGLPARQVQTAQWTNDIWEHYRRVAAFHIGIAPLRPTIFNRSKSGIKAEEYAALGVPTVASSLLPYEGFIRHGETGLLARYPHEWHQHLRALVNDADLRAGLAAKAREQVRAQWTVQDNAWRWADVYSRQLAGAAA